MGFEESLFAYSSNRRVESATKFGNTRTSTPQVPDKLHTDNLNIQRLVQIVGNAELSVKEIMDGIGLKDRKNVLNLYLNPAIAEGYVCLLYPDKPRHPRQKYQLTMRGMALYNELNTGK